MLLLLLDILHLLLRGRLVNFTARRRLSRVLADLDLQSLDTFYDLHTVQANLNTEVFRQVDLCDVVNNLAVDTDFLYCAQILY